MKYDEALAGAKKTALEHKTEIMVVHEGPHTDEHSERPSYGYCPREALNRLYRLGTVVATVNAKGAETKRMTNYDVSVALIAEAHERKSVEDVLGDGWGYFVYEGTIWGAPLMKTGGVDLEDAWPVKDFEEPLTPEQLGELERALDIKNEDAAARLSFAVSPDTFGEEVVRLLREECGITATLEYHPWHIDIPLPYPGESIIAGTIDGPWGYNHCIEDGADSKEDLIEQREIPADSDPKAVALWLQKAYRHHALAHIITLAAEFADLDSSVKRVQDFLGIKTGDVAAQFFSGRDDNDDSWEDAWGAMSNQARAARLIDYVAFERKLDEDDEQTESKDAHEKLIDALRAAQSALNQVRRTPLTGPHKDTYAVAKLIDEALRDIPA